MHHVDRCCRDAGIVPASKRTQKGGSRMAPKALKNHR